MSADQPLVTVVMIFLNESTFLREAIESVVAQTYQNWELLLVDDGSSDGSSELAFDYAARNPGRIRYLEHDSHTNRGMSSSRNLGVGHARGKYVALLDGDDVWLPQKLERQVALLESRPHVGMLYGPTQYWSSWTGRPEDEALDSVPSLGVPVDTIVDPPELITKLYPLGPAPAPCLCSLLIRTDVLRRVGGFEDTFAGFYEDQAFLAKVYLDSAVFISSESWDRYRIHSESCSAVIEQTGQYVVFRRAFLTWLDRYLRATGVTHSGVWDALDRARRSLPVFDGAGGAWRLHVGAGSHATFQINDAANTVRIDVMTAGQSWDVQLHQGGVTLFAGKRYILEFSARAGSQRTICFGVAKAGHAPWSHLGLSQEVALTPEWQTYEGSFVASENVSDARMWFNVGAARATVEVASVKLYSQQDDAAVVVAPSGADDPSDDSPDLRYTAPAGVKALCLAVTRLIASAFK